MKEKRSEHHPHIFLVHSLHASHSFSWLDSCFTLSLYCNSPFSNWLIDKAVTAAQYLGIESIKCTLQFSWQQCFKEFWHSGWIKIMLSFLIACILPKFVLQSRNIGRMPSDVHCHWPLMTNNQPNLCIETIFHLWLVLQVANTFKCKAE